MKRLLVALIFLGIAPFCYGMKKQVLEKTVKENITDLEEISLRTCFAQAFIENIDKVVHRNGFAEKKDLAKIKGSFRAADVSDNKAFKDFFKTAKRTTLLIKEFAKEETYLEQVYCLGHLCVLATSLKFKEENAAIQQKKITWHEKESLEDAVG